LATRQDIRDVLAFTLERFGPSKAKEYASLIRLALSKIIRASEDHVVTFTLTLGFTPLHALATMHAFSFCTKL
jgi:hypothetical protein